ncbi:MAG: peptide-methionine (S)-S-oxide reductase [Rhodobiaceae bacterium]|nr:MAG: peptide-methionine (S)-S-oxide reductase [Rhodobiaceae bacterium]PCJ68512.1 MAG: peptide-methionine (S)-S-oxide reductase [Rhodobiaceae bacterium]
MLGLRKKAVLPEPGNALPGRDFAIPTAEMHFVFDRPLKAPLAPGQELAMFGLGCFWGAERKFWELPEIDLTAVGYAAGFTPNPTYEEVCSGGTGHNEVVLVTFDPTKISYEALLKVFWEAHDPTQGMRQGGDVGTQYRSGIYTFSPAQRAAADASKKMFEEKLTAGGFAPITTEVLDAPEFFYAEDYHQQYLAKVPGGYCGLGGTGVSCPIGTGVGAT